MAKKPSSKSTTELVADTLKTETPTITAKEKASKMTDKSSILELDMSLADYEDFEPLPAGPYPATVTLAELRTSDKGNDYYYVTLSVHVDDYPADYAVENAPEGTNYVYARLQKPDSKNRRSITAIKNWYRALGLDLKSSVINPGEWEGKKCKILTKPQEWNGAEISSIVGVEAID